MSLITDLRQAKEALEASKRHLEELQANPQLVKVQAFEKKLRALLGEYSMSLRDIYELMDPAYKAPKEAKAVAPVKPGKPAKGSKSKTIAPGADGIKRGKNGKPFKTRATRTYTNPHTGEVLVYYGGVNKVRQEWEEKYGKEEVASWGVLNK